MKYIITILITFNSLQAIGQIYGYNNSRKQTFISSSSATLRIQPDQVVLSLGIESRGKDLLTTKNENHKKLSASIKYCQDNGIPDKYIQTDYIRIYPNYHTSHSINIDYYSVSQSFSIILDDLGKYEQILTDLLTLGINKVNNIEFRTTQLKENRYKVRKMAIDAAKEKAKFLASEIGIELGEIINISESTQNPVNSFSRHNYANISQNVLQYDSGEIEDSTLAIGMLSLKANVTLTYEIKE